MTSRGAFHSLADISEVEFDLDLSGGGWVVLGDPGRGVSLDHDCVEDLDAGQVPGGPSVDVS